MPGREAGRMQILSKRADVDRRSQVTGAGLPKPDPNEEHRDLGVNACPVGFWSGIAATFPWQFLVPSFWDGNV